MSTEYRIMIGGNTIEELATEFMKAVAAVGRTNVQDTKSGDTKYGKWVTDAASEGPREPSFTVNGVKAGLSVGGRIPVEGKVTVIFSDLQNSTAGVKKALDARAATAKARLDKAIANAQRAGLDINSAGE